SPVMRRNSVVLPLPLRPMIPQRCRWSTTRFRSWKRTLRPYTTLAAEMLRRDKKDALSRKPGIPLLDRGTDGETVPLPNQRGAQQERLAGQEIEPAFIGIRRRFEAKRGKTFGGRINQSLHAELLGKTPQLAQRGGAFFKIYEVHVDSPLREKTQCRTH